ncbi:von Hippel-Lindau-like protein [Amia ocellicauda]|uniref:von Hippel-Lindau-like protein n=1 Tax=Amia ocellicauda TaxID=2972642 RepID=UPI003463C95D|nr:VHL disease [Amia calva]
MASQDRPRALRSLDSSVPTYVSFVNKCGRDAAAWWLNFSGDPTSYGIIKPGTALAMNTYITHPWVFRVSDSGAKLLANMKEVYFPEATDFQDGEPVFLQVMITPPVYSLQEYCLMLIRRLVKKRDYSKLDITASLKKDLHELPDLQRELTCLNTAFQAMD